METVRGNLQQLLLTDAELTQKNSGPQMLHPDISHGYKETWASDQQPVYADDTSCGFG
jgi:hypothetical protein